MKRITKKKKKISTHILLLLYRIDVFLLLIPVDLDSKNLIKIEIELCFSLIN